MSPRRTALVLSAVALSVAACGSSSPAASPTGTSAAASAPGAASGEPVVHIKDFMFGTASATVTAGKPFMVVNDDSATHTFTSATGGFNSKSIKGGASVELTAPKAGTFDVVCDVHSSMHGTLTVA